MTYKYIETEIHELLEKLLEENVTLGTDTGFTFEKVVQALKESDLYDGLWIRNEEGTDYYNWINSDSIQ